MLDRWVLYTERVASFFLALIAALTFVTVMMRGTIGMVVPDAYDVSRLLLAVAIFWGIATASYRGEHIGVDIVWQALPPRGRRALDLVATAITFAAVAVFAWMLGQKVLGTWASGEATFDLRLPVWPFHLLAALGIFFAVILLAIRLVRLARTR
jgi:TRAP-type C4-dicarboxylate transport system permease small subunit